MPAIQAQQLAQMAKMNFKANAILLPEQFQGFTDQAPFGAKDQKVPDAAAMFVSASTLNYHVDTAKMIGKGVEDLFDVCADTIAKANQNWMSSAKFVGVLINGPAGLVLPGNLVAGPFMSGPMLLATANVSGKQPTFIKYVQSISGAIGTAFMAWQMGVMGMLVFPGGAACSVTMPPSPNVPMPLVALPSPPGEAMMNPAALFGLMMAMHGIPGNHTIQIFQAFSQAFATVFTQWKATTQVMNVTGVGGVAPPPPAPPAPVVAAVGVGGMLQ